MTSNPFFSNPDNPRPKFPFDDDERYDDDWVDEARCTCCKLTLGAHTPAQLVECALKELRGEKN